MKKIFMATVIIAIVIMAVTPCGATYFETITIPVAGATGGQATGINDNGDIVGWYYTSGNIAHGYCISDGVFSTIDYSGADYTVVNGINNDGDLAGYYKDATGLHGFWYDGSYHSYNYNSESTRLTDINDNGDLIGVYGAGDSSDPFTGFLMSDGGVTPLTYPGATSTTVNDINNDGTIVGSIATWESYYWDDYYGFLYDGSDFSSQVAVPFAGVTETAISGINNNGDYVGTYKSGTNVSNGYVMWEGGYDTLNVPGATSTYARDINDSGMIVGGYNVDGLYYGFTCSVPEPSVTLLLLCGLAGLAGVRRRS